MSMLSVTIPAHAAKVLLHDDGRRYACRLAWVLGSTSIEDPEGRAILRHQGGPADELWWGLRRLKGVGPTRTAELLARKRPALFPVYDSLLVGLIGHDPCDVPAGSPEQLDPTHSTDC